MVTIRLSMMSEANVTSSCCSEGVEYRVDDNVRVFDERFSEPHIGKITQLWEDKASETRKVLIRWFLRHKEVKPHADDNPKELFLAFGQGQGVVNENDLDVIVGKCKVVCTSKDQRNKQPSASDIENSDYFFSHVYDVDLEHTLPIEEVIDKLGLNDIGNIDGKATELQGNQTLKDGVKDLLSAGSPRPGVKKRPRDVENISDLRKEKLGKVQLISDESSMKSGSKSSEGSALPSVEIKEKAGGDSVSKLSMTMPGQDSNTSDAILKTIHITDVEKPCGDTGFSPTMAERGEIVSLEYCAVPEGISLEKSSSVQKIFPLHKSTMGGSNQHFIEESPQNGTNLRQTNARGKLDEKGQKKANAFSNDTQKLEGMDGLKLAEKTDSGFTGVESSGSQFSETKELVRTDNTLNSEKLETERGQKPDSAKEGRPNTAKKMKIATYAETEKKPISAIEKRKIFKELPWEENLEQGLPNGKVLLLQNFDPLTTSADVRDILKNTFQGFLDARVLPQESICPSGQALAIFETKVQAECALEAMDMKCLVVTDSKRPVIATRAKESVSQFRFPGHLALEKLKLGRNLSGEEYKKAVSTSHCSQPNTIEFEMAMEWRQLQEITQNCRAELFKKQKKEVIDRKSHGITKGTSRLSGLYK